MDRYRSIASLYDLWTSEFHYWRRRMVDLLPLWPGDTVIDVGCGTGLCFPLLQSRIGPRGTIVGIDRSPEMLALARRRAEGAGWSNVVLVTSAVERAVLDVMADAALLCAIHDVMQSDEALANVIAHVREGGTVAAAGGKWGHPSLTPVVWSLHRPFVSSFAGFDQPWRNLEALLPGLEVTEVALGTGYLAVGPVKRAQVDRR